MGDFSHSGVPQGQAGEAFRSLQGLHHGGPQQREVGGLLRPLHQNGIRPEVRPPVDHRHMAADVCQIQRILQGGAAASGHCHILSGVKGSVAHSAEGDAGQTILARKAQGPAPHPGGQDYRPGGIGTVVGDHPAGRAALDLQRLLQFDSGLQGLGLAVQPLRQFSAGHGGQARKVFHLGGGGDLPAEALPLQQQNGLSCPAGVDGGGEPGRAAAHDNDVEILVHRCSSLMTDRR